MYDRRDRVSRTCFISDSALSDFSIRFAVSLHLSSRLLQTDGIVVPYLCVIYSKCSVPHILPHSAVELYVHIFIEDIVLNVHHVTEITGAVDASTPNRMVVSIS